VLQPLPGPPLTRPAQNSGKAIASLICGLFLWLFPAAVAAVILGHVSLSDINRSAGRLAGRGMAIAGLVLGYAGVFFIPIILIVAAIAIPNLLRARQAANEAVAIEALRTINVAAVTYSSKYGNGFPPTLATMDGAGEGEASCDHARLIDARLASGVRDGYVLTYLPTGMQVVGNDAKARGCGTPGSSSYEVHADPVNRGTTGQRSFYTDQTGVVRAERNAPATADSAALE
jgi:type II secretory pathway pseudopilin PulG